MEIKNTPRVLLVGSWGSEGLVSAFTDVLYRGASWEEALGAQTPRNTRPEKA
jgi:thymidylate synthase (FAD)